MKTIVIIIGGVVVSSVSYWLGICVGLGRAAGFEDVNPGIRINEVLDNKEFFRTMSKP